MKKETKMLLNSFLVVGLIVLFTYSCKKSDDNNNNPPANAVTDADGNVYHTVTIGTQVWMVENLKTTKYNDGSPIPLVSEASDWANLITPAYCWYDNNIGYKNIYGALYKWNAVNTGKLAPTGWHVPTEADWQTLETYLGGPNVAGGKLKEAGTSHWESPNTAATNESGFTAYGGGYRSVFQTQPGIYTCLFSALNREGLWWSSTYYQTEFKYIYLDYNDADMYKYESSNLIVGYSVRCIKN